MRRILLVGLFALAGCDSPPATPVPPAPAPTLTPASITLLIAGPTSLKQSVITLSVLDAANRGVGDQAVALSTTNGELSSARVVTAPNGQAQALLTHDRTATVTATLGSLSKSAQAPAFALPLNVSVSASPARPFKLDDVTFAATVAGGSSPYAYAWIFGDGSSGSGASVVHRYAEDGAKAVRVTVTDTDGRTASGSVSVDVQAIPAPVPPTPTPAPSLSVSLTCTAATHGSPTPCNVSASYGGAILPGTAITDVDWDWGDGAQDLNQLVPIITHTYGQAGSFTVTAIVTATTVDGAKTATVTKALTIP